MHGDEFVWDEFVGDELLGDKSSGSRRGECVTANGYTSLGGLSEAIN